MNICVTGHRPNKLGGYGMQSIIEDFATETLKKGMEKLPSDLKVITGMAIGWDQAIAVACLRLDIPFIAAVPFVGQEKLWPPKTQERYHDLKSRAYGVVVVSDEGYSSSKMHRRNAWMVDHSNGVLALWDGTSGGTSNCIKYAEEKGISVWNVWDQFVSYRDKIVKGGAS